MRFDLITIFPEYFEPLKLSLLGKAQQEGGLEIEVHNLRDWAQGKHLSVDGAPAGGGAGMVMRPDVWGNALDSALSVPLPTGVNHDSGGAQKRVIAIPTPSGKQLTQRDLEALAGADQIIVACGRYEGVDARVADAYRMTDDADVFEFSLGDYVLNGGEVAGLALVEGVSRLLEGVIGNPESLVEESHSEAGLLEYPVFTHPRLWRQMETPPVLSSGNHGLIARWRRDQSLRRTARRRPDLLWDLARRSRDERGRPEGLDSRDLEVLARCGFLLAPHPGRVFFESWGPSEPVDPRVYYEVSQVASSTFPLACPPGTDPLEIEEFIAQNLTPGALRRNVEHDGARICAARIAEPVPPWDRSTEESEARPVVAYTLMFPSAPEDLVADADQTSYLSKCYTEEWLHGSGISGALVQYALDDAKEAWGPRPAVLGTNVANKRAIRFYRNQGFKKSGTRVFQVGNTLHRDNVYVLDLTAN